MKDKNEKILRKKCKKFLKDKTWGSSIRFLDTINSIEELDIIQDMIENNLESWYRENIKRWENPILPNSLKEKYPLVCEKIDTPQKVRIFFRAADFRSVSISLMAEVFEDVLQKQKKELKKLTILCLL